MKVQHLQCITKQGECLQKHEYMAVQKPSSYSSAKYLLNIHKEHRLLIQHINIKVFNQHVIHLHVLMIGLYQTIILFCLK